MCCSHPRGDALGLHPWFVIHMRSDRHSTDVQQARPDVVVAHVQVAISPASPFVALVSAVCRHQLLYGYACMCRSLMQQMHAATVTPVVSIESHGRYSSWLWLLFRLGAQQTLCHAMLLLLCWYTSCWGKGASMYDVG